MKILLSLPENTVKNIELLTKNRNDCFAISDPEGVKIGSGGGTSWLVSKFLEKEPTFKGKKIIIHAGGQSRRLPAYAPLGKSFIPCPVFRWERAQRMGQTLMDLQLPLLENLMSAAPEGVNTLISSGDALIWSEPFIERLPEADIICMGICVDPAIASNHGVFVSERKTPDKLEYMLQKPDQETLKRLNIENLFLIDTGIWLLSDKALDVIMKKSGWNQDTCSYRNTIPDFYDLYGTFGLSLGSNPTENDPDIAALTTAIITLDDGRFFHFGTSSEIISSSLELQNMVVDQRSIWNRNIKPHLSIFTQNSIIKTTLSDKNQNLWIENSFIPESWNITQNNLITGVPENDWKVSLDNGICLDIIPVGNNDLCIRSYHISDKFKGQAGAAGTMFMGTTVKDWAALRGFSPEDIGINPETDIYDAAVFPVLSFKDITSEFFSWFINGVPDHDALDTYLQTEKLSSADILVNADIKSLEEQRIKFRAENWKTIRKNYKKSVFFQTDLLDAAEEFNENKIELSCSDLTGESDPQILMQDFMFESLLCSQKDKAENLKRKAFGTLQQAIIDTIVSEKSIPKLNVFEDQIVWARSPVRIDLAGGWTDTPPYCVINGGSVVGVSLELNGQPPLQTFIRPSKEKRIILRSIDLGEREVVSTFEDLATYSTVGSAFSIPKAALALAGFYPDFSTIKYRTLEQQLDDFGSGIEISFLAAIPKGSGMGTSIMDP